MSLPLHVADLRLRSPRGRLLLDLPALSATPGALIGIRGASGAGKTTLLYALAGLLDRAEGSVRWGDTELLSLGSEGRARFRARNIGMIFQDFMLFEELGALDNASLTALFRPRSERPALRARARARLEALGLTDAERRVTSFSGGERQRVAIARAMAAEAPVLLADEPTASLDRANADRLIDDLVALVRTQGTTLIAVSHDPALLDRMDRVLTIEGGALAADEVPACA
ncbi:ABC transporter ATP-binding protein [Alloyangia pacifica]|uniref:Putative ABC transport system ATP-binding protein n=1 Tax=Alloyangia pacifica TaxID=311180 RepID=A0A1I6WIN1_9RHOB|nr:ATP-binding cassette domain-containing protein [Alloyangia pacifica]SDI80183.1 putative ABC transport system ATP-binding protein [Alloyangia pacifica]SFT25835.1 putative ABC transport system ATP-binding protein [Alloyangia pacifica]